MLLNVLATSHMMNERDILSSQTYEGLRITSYFLIEVTKYLLNADMPYVLSEHFSQNVFLKKHLD